MAVYEPVSYTHLDVYKRQVLGRDHMRPERIKRCPPGLGDDYAGGPAVTGISLTPDQPIALQLVQRAAEGRLLDHCLLYTSRCV